MASPSHPTFPSPPSSSPPPPPPPSKPAAASSSQNNQETRLFELKFKQVRFLHEAFKVLVTAADGPEGIRYLPRGKGRITGAGRFYISSDDVNLVARTILPPDANTCLALRRITTAFNVTTECEVCLDLRLLEQETARAIDTVGGDCEGLTLCLKAENTRVIVLSLQQGENDNEAVHRSVIPVMTTTLGGGQTRLRWSGLVDTFILSVRISTPNLEYLLSLKGTPVRITVVQYAVVIRVGGEMIELRERSNVYKIVRRTRDYPLRMGFPYFHPEDAILAAASLSPFALFHLTSDSRCVLEIGGNGVSSIFFCFTVTC